MVRSRRIAVGVMGSAGDVLAELDRERLAAAAEQLGGAIAARKLVLVTGATTGLPDMVARTVAERGGLTIGISPAANCEEHVGRFGLPADASDIMIYTGFGLKGRNVINIRTSDIVIIVGGGMGTLNEFTIAYDEGKVIGVLRGSGGVADHIEAIVDVARKSTNCRLVVDDDPQRLIGSCVEALAASEAGN